jgi:branched-chain amino acid transport system ATP-binding protein
MLEQSEAVPALPVGSAQEPLLALKNVRVRYGNGGLGVLDVSFSVLPGQVVGLFGPNGAGKTTSVRAASGFLKTEGARVIGGTVTLAGQDVTNFEPHRQAGLGLSFVPERDKVFASLSVAENLVAIGKPPRGARKAELMDLVFTLFPILAERRRQLAGRLSGGQRQMLALARGVISDPRILIVDEMSLGLHESVQPPLFEAVRRVAAAGTAVLLVDESTSFALAMADYCYLLAGGEIRAEGTAEDFRTRDLLSSGYTDIV